MFEVGKLNLTWVNVKTMCSTADLIVPVPYPLNDGEDASLMFILFIMNMAKGRKEKRFMPVGGHRARTKINFN